MNDHLKNVKSFHEVFEVNIEDNPKIPDGDRVILRADLLQEELSEFIEACEKRDLVKVADALVDLEYILCGTVLEFGLADIFDKLFKEVHRSNMTKLTEDGKVLRRKDGKVLKSELFEEPNLEDIIKGATDES